MSVSFAAGDSELTVGEPVFLTAVIENPLGEPLLLNVGPDRIRPRLIRPDGKRQVPTQRVFTLSSLRNHVTVQPSGSFREVFLLNKWFAFDVPGRYMLDVQLLGGASAPDGVLVEDPPEQHVPIVVRPRDAARLGRICDDLEREVDNASSYDGAVNSAEALSYIADPIAVPYLARLLDSRKLFEVHAIRGLEQVANGGAVDVLISHRRSGSEETQGLIQVALARIEARTSDPGIKGKIEGAR